MPDPIFSLPRLAELYDRFDGDRSDLDAYLEIATELGARSLLDLGCGTGTFACLLAERGLTVVGADPAAASLAIARAKPFADRVRWIEADATQLPAMQVDLVTMTANVAQVFLTDDDWALTLACVRGALRPGGFLVFEVRDPTRRAWLGWTPDATSEVAMIEGVGRVETWTEVTSVDLPFVSFRHTFVFEIDGAVVESDSTLRFRSHHEIVETLETAGFEVVDTRDARDRPGQEFVFVTTRLD